MAKRFNLKRILAPVGDIVRKLKSRRDELMGEVDLIDSQLARFGGGVAGNGRKKQSTAAAPKRRGRKRRSRQDLEMIAQEVVQFIGGKGKEGVSGKEIKAQFGDLLPSVNAWLKNYSTAKVKTTGAKSRMLYHA